MKKKRGFTLAEILITITILGVIAAVTLPALRSDAERMQWEQGLKITVANLNEGFARMLADNETDSLADTKLFNQYIDSKEYTNGNSELAKYFNLDKSYAQDSNTDASVISGQTFYELDGTKYTVTDTNSIINLVNGAKMHMLFKTSQSDRNAAKYDLRLYIDVNGDKGPNTFGKDIYVFYVTDDGKIIAKGSKTANDLGIDATYWNSEKGCSGDTPGGSGLYCAGRVVEEGYKIKYKF